MGAVAGSLKADAHAWALSAPDKHGRLSETKIRLRLRREHRSRASPVVVVVVVQSARCAWRG